MSKKTAFIEFILKSQVLTFGDFITKSGRKSPYFINTGNYVTGRQLLTLGQFYADAVVSRFGKKVTNLYGPAYKGIPICTATSMVLAHKFNKKVTFTFNRKENKDHGEGGRMLGHQYGRTGDKVVIVEDVTTAGTSVRECIPWINAHENTSVIGLVVSVDRQERGTGKNSALQELQDEFGIETVSLINFQDLMNFIRKNPDKTDIPAQILEKMEIYHREFGAVESDR